MNNNRRNPRQLFVIALSVLISSIFVAQNAVALDSHKADTKIHSNEDVSLLDQNITMASNFVSDFFNKLTGRGSSKNHKKKDSYENKQDVEAPENSEPVTQTNSEPVTQTNPQPVTQTNSEDIVGVVAQAGTGVPGFLSDFLKEDNLAIGGQYKVGFNSIKEVSKFYIVPQNDKKSASHDLTSEKSIEGGSSHKAWMYGANSRKKGVNTNHRAYPTFQMKKTKLGVIKTAALVDIWVWADIDMYRSEDKSWFSIATLTSYADNKWSRSYLVNVDSDYKLHLMYVPDHPERNPDIFVTKKITFPRAKWVRVTTFIDYTKNNRFSSPLIALWQDGQLIAASRLNTRINIAKLPAHQYPKCLGKWDKKDLKHAEDLCGLEFTNGLAQMHFGLYTPPLLTKGVIYNDKLEVSEIIRK